MSKKMLNGAPVTGKNSLQAFLEYFKTVQGWLSVVPGIVSIVDYFFNFLPISSALKPWVYGLIILLVLFDTWYEVALYVDITRSKSEYERMNRRALWRIFIAILCILIYWVGAQYLQESVPESALLRSLALFFIAFVAALVFGEATRAFVILALKIYISKYRP